MANQDEPQAGACLAIPSFVQPAQRRQRALERTLAALPIREKGTIVRQRAYKLDFVLCEEGGQVAVGRILEDGQVATVDDLAAERTHLLDKPAELRMDLRSPSGDVHDRDVVRCNHLETAV